MDSRDRRSYLILGVALLAALLFLLGPAVATGPGRALLKPVPVLCLALMTYPSTPDRFALLLAWGLAVSAVGDLLLEGNGLFLAGLATFLLAHLLYLSAFVLDVRRLLPTRLVPFLAWGGLAFHGLQPGLHGMTWPVVAYMGAIVAMMWRAAARVGVSPRGQASARWALFGAVLFGASDTLLAYDRFGQPIEGVRLPILFLYWLGQAGLARSACPDRPSQLSG
jgi:uncharacterized membrane protein YhhN